MFFKYLTRLTLFLSLIFSVSVFGAQKVKILECMQPVNLDDPNFVQGSELFFDIYLVEGVGIEVDLTRGNLDKGNLFKATETKRHHLDLIDHSLSSEWIVQQNGEPKAITLVARQFETRWYGEFWFSHGYTSSLIEILPGRDLQISCIEKSL